MPDDYGHTPLHGRRVTQPPTRGTGLYDGTQVNGRQAEPWELEIRERAYQRMRQQDVALVSIAPRDQP